MIIGDGLSDLPVDPFVCAFTALATNASIVGGSARDSSTLEAPLSFGTRAVHQQVCQWCARRSIFLRLVLAVSDKARQAGQ